MKKSEINELLRKACELRAQADAAQKELDALKKSIRALMEKKGVEELETTDHRATLKPESRKTVDRQKLETLFPAVAAECMKDQKISVLRFN